MNSKEFIQKLMDIVDKYKTVYMLGCYGMPVTEALITSKSRQLPNWYTTAKQAQLRKLIGKEYYGFDCVNLIKGILWGFPKSKYSTNGVPDINADGMINKCIDVSADFKDIIPGEAVWLPGHIGVYIGDGKVVECTPKWDNDVQITACLNIGPVKGLYGRTWQKHGKIPYIEYEKPTAKQQGIEAIRYLTQQGRLSDSTTWINLVNSGTVKNLEYLFIKWAEDKKGLR